MQLHLVQRAYTHKARTLCSADKFRQHTLLYERRTFLLNWGFGYIRFLTLGDPSIGVLHKCMQNSGYNQFVVYVICRNRTTPTALLNNIRQW